MGAQKVWGRGCTPRRGAAAALREFWDLGEELKHVLISLKSPARLNPRRLGPSSIIC